MNTFGEVTFLTRDGVLGQLDGDGYLRWSLLVGPSRSGPALDEDGSCYVAGRDGQLYAVSRAGRLLWMRPLGGRPLGGVAVGPTIIAVALAVGEVRFWKRQGGVPLSKLGLGAGPTAGPALTPDEKLVIPTAEGELIKLEQKGIIWRTRCSEHALGPIAIGNGGEVYVGAADGTISAIKPDGTVAWRVQAKGSIEHSPVLSEDGLAFVAADSEVLAILAGEIKWRRRFERAVIGGPLVASDGTVYVTIGGDQTRARAVALSPDGKRRIQFALPARPTPGLSLADGMLWISFADWTLRRFPVPQRALARSPWAKARGGRANASISSR